MNFVYCKNEEQIKKLLDFRQDSRVYFTIISSLSQLKKAAEDNLKYLVCVYINEDDSQMEEMVEVVNFLRSITVKKYLACYSTNSTIILKFQNTVHEIIKEPFSPRRLLQLFKAAHYTLQKQVDNADTMQELTDLWKEVEDIKEKKDIFSRELLFLLESVKSERKAERLKEIYQEISPNLTYPGKEMSKTLFEGKEFVYEVTDFMDDYESATYVAKKSGFLIVEGNRVRFQTNLFLSEDNMDAHMFFYPLDNISFTESLNLFWDEVAKQLDSETVNRDAFLENVKTANTHKIIFWKTVAKGIIPQNGQNEHVVFLKEQEYKNLKDNKGMIIDNLGTMNFRERANILTVKKAEAIAKKMPEIKNIDGLTVLGRKIKSRYVKKIPYGIGDNLVLNPETGIYEASMDGMVLLTRKTISVEETLVISGDVDLEYGNVHYDKNVRVTGNIVSGMHVVCGGNLVVEGVIENAAVSVDGDLLVNGVIGCHNTPLFVKGNIFVNFFENSFADCLQNFNFTKHLLNANLRTVGKILGGEDAKIIGGTLLSAAGVEADYIGNEEETKTKIDLGANFYLDQRLSKIMGTIKKLKVTMQTELTTISQYINLKENVNEQLKNMPAKQASALLEKFSLLKNLREKENNFEEVYNELKSSIAREFSAFMLVRKTVYPNVFLTIVGLNRKIQEYQHRVVFYLNNETLQLDKRYL